MTSTTTAPGTGTSNAAAFTHFGEPARRPDAGTVTPEGFFQMVRAINPFTDNRVNGPAPADVDVPGIHEAAFRRLVALAQEAHAGRRGVGVLLWGEAGIGKSHLLARLGRWAEDGGACYVYLHNLQAGPESLPRSLLRAVLNQLTLGQVRHLLRTPLFRLVLELVSEALDRDTTVRHSWLKAERAYARLLNRIAADDALRATPTERTIYEVFFRLFRSVCRAYEGDPNGVAPLAVRWLAGDGLDPEEAELLGVPRPRDPARSAVLEDNQAIKQVLAALTRLATSAGRPFILAFDQADNLDHDQAAALTRFLEALLDGAANLLVVTAGVKASLLDFRAAKVIQDSAWDRVAQFDLTLQRVAPAEARHMVASRLERTLEPFLEVPAVRERVQGDPLFPLGEDWAADFLGGKIEVRPRDVVNAAREGWRREQERLHALGGAAWLATWTSRPAAPAGAGQGPTTAEQIREAIDREVEEKVREQQALRRREYPLPTDADHLAGLLTNLLRQCRQAQSGIPPLEIRREEPYSLLFNQKRAGAGGPARTGVLVLATANAWATTAALRKLAHSRTARDRIFLVTDARQPLAFGRRPDAQGRQFYQQLRQRGPERFQAVELSAEEYAYLDALQAVVGLARSGELEAELPGGRAYAIQEDEVIASHYRCDRYRAAVLLRELLWPSESANKK